MLPLLRRPLQEELPPLEQLPPLEEPLPLPPLLRPSKAHHFHIRESRAQKPGFFFCAASPFMRCPLRSPYGAQNVANDRRLTV
jgi:hypothetical protein